MAVRSSFKTTTSGPMQQGNDHRPTRIFPFLVVLGALGVLSLGPTLSPKGHLSYAYLRSLFFDGDLNVVNEAQQPTPAWPEGISLEPNRETGLPSTPAAAGPGLLWSPFLFVAHLVVLGLRATGLSVTSDGYNQFYFLAINVATFFYLVLGCVLTVTALRRFGVGRHLVVLVLAAVLGSPLLSGSLVDGSLPDALSLLGAGFFLFEWSEYRRDPTLLTVTMLGIAAGMLCLIRPLNLIMVPWPVLEMLRFSPRPRERDYWLSSWYVALVFLAMSPQLLIWRAQHGLPWPPAEHRPEVALGPTGLFKYLFSWPAGLAVNFPFYLLGAWGLLLAARQDKRLGLPVFLAFLSSVLLPGTMTAPWWQPSEAARFTVSCLPFAALGAGYLLVNRWNIPRPLAIGLGVLLVLWTILCDLYEVSFSAARLIPSTAFMIPRLLLYPGEGFGVTQAMSLFILVAGVIAALVAAGRVYEDVTQPAAKGLFAQTGRRIGISATVIVSADLIVCAAGLTHHQVLVPVQVGQQAYRVVPYAFNRFAKFEQVNLGLAVGPESSRTLYFSPAHAVSAVYLVTRVSPIRDIPLGTSVARISVRQKDRTESALLEFGEETVAERSKQPFQQLRGNVEFHEWRDKEGRTITSSSCRLDLPRPVIAEQVVVENLVSDATLTIDGLGFRPSPVRVISADRLRSGLR